MKKAFLFLVVATLLAATLTAKPVSSEPGPTVYVDPATTTAYTSEDFTVAINIADVVDLHQWWFVIDFDSTTVECISLEEGPFLKQGGATTWMAGTPSIDNTLGQVIGLLTLGGLVPGVDGSGTLAYIKFHCLGPGDTDLHFNLAALYNRYDALILPLSSIDGYVQQLQPVGGVWVPINKTELFAPWIILASVIAVASASVVYVKHRKKP